MTDRQGYQALKEKKLALHSQPALDKPFSRLQAQAWARKATGEDSWSLVLGLGALLTQTTCYLCPAAQGSWLRLAKLSTLPPLLLALGSMGRVQTMQLLLLGHCPLKFRRILVAYKVRLELKSVWKRAAARDPASCNALNRVEFCPQRQRAAALTAAEETQLGFQPLKESAGLVTGFCKEPNVLHGKVSSRKNAEPNLSERSHS